ncbi:MAG TPA: alkaline phosphatase family protein [Pyrinomonadaceae bacterium]|jgi:predicted AlkP superfamily phosphohydrolase/phosphomutase
MGSTERRRRVLAVGLDAAEPWLVRRLIEAGELPSLKRLLEGGAAAWSRVASPATVGSGAVWPTFMTGTDAHEHGIHSEWSWQPERMRVAAVTNDHLTPFWKGLALEGIKVGVLDVPFAPTVGLSRGFEISEWGSHDPLVGHMLVSPPALDELIARSVGPHPFSSAASDATAPDDQDELKRHGEACLQGTELRGRLAAQLLSDIPVDLALIVFTEIHHASHRLWHTVESAPRAVEGDTVKMDASVLLEVYREVDRQIGRLVAQAGSETTVIVFSLHGMRPCQGIASLTEPLLINMGFAHLSGWRTQSWAERAKMALAAIKRRTPRPVKDAYYGLMSRSVITRLAQPTMLPAYDWSRTRAFALPTDQHGWIRLNLEGREALGAVKQSEYEVTCEHIEKSLRALVTEDGLPLVLDVLCPAMENGGIPPRKLPDIVVHWTDAALTKGLRLKDHALETRAIALKQTGQHAPEGFCIVAGRAVALPDGETIAARDLHRLIVSALAAG